MRYYRLRRLPRSLQHSTARLNNVVLVPASLLPLKKAWQTAADNLGYGEILIILPRSIKSRRVASSVASQLQQQGKNVTVVAEPMGLTTIT